MIRYNFIYMKEKNIKLPVITDVINSEYCPNCLKKDYHQHRNYTNGNKVRKCIWCKTIWEVASQLMFIDTEHLKILNINLEQQLNLLQETYNDMRTYYMKCSAIGSGLIYSSDDFDREGYIIDKIRTTKDKLNTEKQC